MQARFPLYALGLCVALVAQPARAVGVAVRNNAPHPVFVEVEFAANAVGTGDITFTWDFGDGTKSEPSNLGTAKHVYTEPGHYSVIVVAKDESGARSVRRLVLSAGLLLIRSSLTPLSGALGAKQKRGVRRSGLPA